MPRFIQRPATVELVQWTGNNLEEIAALVDDYYTCRVDDDTFIVDSPNGEMGRLALNEWTDGANVFGMSTESVTVAYQQVNGDGPVTFEVQA